MSSTNFCSQCGAALPPKARFCRECGSPINAAPRSSPRQVVHRPTPRRTKPDTRQIPWPWLILTLGAALLITGYIISRQESPPVAVENFPSGSTNSDTASSSAPAPAADIPFPEVPRISISDTKNAVDNGTALVVDVRDAEDYAAGHIPGAVHIPSEDIEARHPELSRGMTIITYCT